MSERLDGIAANIREEIIVNNLKPPQSSTPIYNEVGHEAITVKPSEQLKGYYPPTGRKKKKEGYESNTGLKDINDQEPPQNNPKKPYIPPGNYRRGPKTPETDQLPQNPKK